MGARYRSAEDDIIYTGVGEIVAGWRVDRGMSVKALADRVRVSDSTIQHVEDGSSCSVPTLVRIARVFGCPIDELVPEEVRR